MPLNVEIEQIYEKPLTPVHDINELKLLCEIDRNVPYDTFFKKFLINNVPCIVKNVASTWECTKSWIKNETINWNNIVEKYGALEAPIAYCDKVSFNAHCKSIMKVEDYVHKLKNDKQDLLYLKDWHLKKMCPDDNFYTVPLIFASDWLNEFALDNNEDDFMFVYIGPENSWTPLHVDVYNSYSWSVNIIGKKHWTLFPPGEENKLMDQLGNLPVMFCPEKFMNINYITLTQEKGDAVFVPSGWHHQVVNELDTISINHNWINACNLEHMWRALERSIEDVENEIIQFKDTPDFISQCQLILKSVFGTNYKLFIEFMLYIANKRLKQIKHDQLSPLFNLYTLGQNHIIFDLKAIFKVMSLAKNHYLFMNENISIEKEYFFKTEQLVSKVLT